jgi:hypothetical protein
MLNTTTEHVIAQERAGKVVLFLIYFKICFVVEGAGRVSETVLLTQPYLSIDTTTWNCSNVARSLSAEYRHAEMLQTYLSQIAATWQNKAREKGGEDYSLIRK